MANRDVHALSSNAFAVKPADTPEGAQGALSNQVIERTLCVQISGSLANLALAGPQAAMWKPVTGKEPDIFCPSMSADMDPTEAVNTIRNGVIRSVSILEHSSTFPCALGATISCIPASEVTDIGEKYAYTVLPKSYINTPQVVYKYDATLQEGANWRQLYPKWNSNNLESEGIMDVKNQPFVFVHMDHPVVGLLRHNAELIGCKIDEQPKIDNQWYKLTKQVLSTCCHTLRSKVLNKMVTQDLSMFSFQLHRLNANGWDDLGDGSTSLQGFFPMATWTDGEKELEKEHHLRQFVTTPYQYIARLKIEYEVPRTA